MEQCHRLSAEDVKIGDYVKISYEDVTSEITLPKFRKA